MHAQLQTRVLPALLRPYVHTDYLAGESSAHEEADDDGSRRQVPWKGSEGILSAVKAMACLFLHDLLGHLNSTS